MKGAKCIRGRTILRGDEATTIPFVTPASPFLPPPPSPIPFEASTTILGHDLAPPGRPLRLVLPTHTFDPSLLSLQSSPLPSPLLNLVSESPLSSSYSNSSHNPYFPFQGHSHSDDLQPHHAPAQLLRPSSPPNQNLLNMEWPANNQTYPSFTQDLDLDVPRPPPSAASTSSSSSWERVAMPQEANQSPLHQETTLPLFTSTHPTQPPPLPQQAPRRPPSTTTRVNELSQAQTALTTMPPPVRYASTSPPGAAQASSLASTSAASADPVRLQIVTSTMTMDPNRDLNLAASQSWNSATTTNNNAQLHLPHGNSLQPDLEHFYYQQQRQRQQLVVDMGMEPAMAMVGMAAPMGAHRAPLPRQDSSLRPQRSISSIAQARHQANQRHHSNSNSPTSNNWELGMEAYRQQQQAERQRRSSEEAEYIQRLSASYNNSQAIHMHPSHPTQHPTLQHPPLHSPQGYYHPQRHHPQGISHPHSDLSNSNNHTLPNTHRHPHTLHHSHSNNSLNIPRPNNSNTSSSTSSSINNSPIHPHFPTHPLHPAGAIHLTAHDHLSQIHHHPAYVMHEETEGFGPHTTNNNSNSSLEVAAGMVMGADNMPVHSNSTAKFASASFLTPTLHLG